MSSVLGTFVKIPEIHYAIILTFPIDPFKSPTLVISLQNKPTLSCNRIVCASSDIGNSRIDCGRIGTPIVNEKIWSVDDKFSVRSDVGKADKLDTIVQQYPTNEGNTASLRIEEESLESIFSKIIKESNSRERMNLAKPLNIETPNLIHFGNPPIETENVENLLVVSLLPEYRTRAVYGGARIGMIGWRIRMILKQ